MKARMALSVAMAPRTPVEDMDRTITGHRPVRPAPDRPDA